ncbi:MAG: efflux RND transporter periplasmic adaptor subunit [Planctomycetes bacterium]|nr:efflux RND transporter periplasmic adaptor subunit [Planctomycetota bacterium]
MNTTKKNLALAGILVLLLVGAGYRFHVMRSRGVGPAAAATGTCPHTLSTAECPFCTPALLETKGFCGGHGVPEAICTRCHKDVIPAFKAINDWCAEHNLPESQCVTCNPEVAGRHKPPAPGGSGHGQGEGAFCGEHGVAEAICFICSPALVEQRGMCTEHGVPEALCTRCNAALIPAFKKTFDWCAEHEVPESQCVICNPRLAAPPPASAPMSPEARRHSSPVVGCRKHAQKIQLASADVVRQTGIVTTPVVRAPFRDLTTVNVEIVYAADRRAEVSSRVPGTVVEVNAKLGDWVEEGAVLASIESPELGAAKSELTTAVSMLELWERNHARELGLVERGLGTQRAVIDADTRRTEVKADLARAEQRLRSIGLTADQAAKVREGGANARDSTLAIRAPFAGVVVRRDAVRGQVVETRQPLLTIVDTDTMWALLDVPEAAIARIAPDQPVVFAVHALRGESFSGHITWISSEVDRRTRTLKARAELKNGDGRLRANLFGTAQVTLSDRGDALLVPREAVQWEGCCNVVFLPEGDTAFLPRKVQLGGATDTHVEVLAGLSDGEAVVSVGAFLLKTEILKGSIGAGCCEGE